jgi:hypothetical protein
LGIVVVDGLFERILAAADAYARLAEQAHDQTVAREYQELAREWRELAIRLDRLESSRLGPAASTLSGSPLSTVDVDGQPAETERRSMSEASTKGRLHRNSK